MSKNLNKFLSLFLSFCLILEQSVFAQTIDLSHYFARGSNQTIPQSDKFRPLHLRYLSYDNQANDFKLLLDKGDFFNQKMGKPKNEKTPELEKTTQELMKYFFIGLALPNDKFWVNLRPDSPDNILDPDLEKTDIGRIFLEADVNLKQDTAGLTSPQTPEGKQYWDKLYKKAGELFGSENISIPTLTRPWIVPDEVIIRESPEGAYIYKATLKVMLEEDYLRGTKDDPAGASGRGTIASYSFNDPRLKELNEYSTQLIKESIIPKLTQAVNTSKRYAPLRQVYYSLILAQWFKQKYGSSGSTRASGTRVPVNNYIDLIDSGNLANLASTQPYDKQTYFQQYQKSFQDGEYNLQEPVYTPMGQSIRRYVSGGMSFVVVSSAITPIQASGYNQIGNNAVSYLKKCRVIGAPTSNFEVQFVSSPLQEEVKKELCRVITELRNGRKSLVGKIPFLTKEMESKFRSGKYAVKRNFFIPGKYEVIYTSGKRGAGDTSWEEIGLSANPSQGEMLNAYRAFDAWEKSQVGFPMGNLKEALDNFRNTTGRKYGISLKNVTFEDMEEELQGWREESFYEITGGDIYFIKELLDLLPEQLLKNRIIKTIDFRMQTRSQADSDVGLGKFIKESGELGIMDNDIKFDRYMMTAVFLHEMGHALIEVMTDRQKMIFDSLYQQFQPKEGLSDGVIFSEGFLGSAPYRKIRQRSQVEFFAENFMHFVILGEKIMKGAFVLHQKLRGQLYNFYKEFYGLDEFRAKFSEISSSSLTEEDIPNNIAFASSAAEGFQENKLHEADYYHGSTMLFTAPDINKTGGNHLVYKGFFVTPKREWAEQYLYPSSLGATKTGKKYLYKLRIKSDLNILDLRRSPKQNMDVFKSLIEKINQRYPGAIDYSKIISLNSSQYAYESILISLNKNNVARGEVPISEIESWEKDPQKKFSLTPPYREKRKKILYDAMLSKGIDGLYIIDEGDPTLILFNPKEQITEIKEIEPSVVSNKETEDVKVSSSIVDNPGGIDLSRINKSIRAESVSSSAFSGGNSPVDVDFNVNEELIQLQKLLNAEIIPSADRLNRYARAVRASFASSPDSADSALSLVAETFRLQEEKAVSAPAELKALAAWLEQGG